MKNRTIERSHRAGSKLLKWTCLASVLATFFILNPSVLTGCGPLPVEGGYGGCPRYIPTKQAVRDALDEVPLQYLVEHDDGTLQVDFTWLSIEMVRNQDFSLIKSSYASTFCSEIETIAVDVSMTLTWIPHTGEPEVLAQNIRFHPTRFHESSTGLSETEDEVAHFIAANDTRGYWHFRIHRVRPEDYQVTVSGLEHPHPGRPRLKWLDVQDGELSTFKPEIAPEDWSP